jgi:hypothetical protein
MKRLILAGLMLTGVIATGDARHLGYKQSGVAISAGYVSGGIAATFNAPLTPYGEWIDCNYGNVWRPYSVGAHWRPYMNGRWVWTSYGWYWTSYEPYGWAVYHYGRWTYDDYYGWIWIPDDVWGPAWVEWRYDDDYIGWAPLTPYATFDVSFGVTLNHGWVAPVHYWNFVPCGNFTATRVDAYIQPVEQTRRFFGSTRVVPSIRTEQNRVVNRGVDPAFVERKSGSRVKVVDVVESNRGTGERVVRGPNTERIEVYRPDIGRTRGGENGQPRFNDGVQRNNSQRPYRDIMNDWKQEHRVNTPDNSGIRRNAPPNIRQFRESEQRFEIPNMKESFERRANTAGREGRSTPPQEVRQGRPQDAPAQLHNQTPRNQQAPPAARQQSAPAQGQRHVTEGRSGKRP